MNLSILHLRRQLLEILVIFQKRKDQHIINAMVLVTMTTIKLQEIQSSCCVLFFKRYRYPADEICAHISRAHSS